MMKHIAFILTFVTLALSVRLVPRPVQKLNANKVKANRWNRYHSLIGHQHNLMAPNEATKNGHGKWYPKKYGPTPASCHYDCQLEYHTSYNIPLMQGETECPDFKRSRSLEVDTYSATNWRYICFQPNVTLCTYCLEVQTLREYGQIMPNKQSAMFLRQTCKYQPPEDGCKAYMDLANGACECQEAP